MPVKAQKINKNTMNRFTQKINKNTMNRFIIFINCLVKSIVFSFIFLFNTFLVFSTEDTIKSFSKSDIVVSAKRDKRPLLDIPYSISLIDNHQLNNNNNTPDILKTATGAWVQKTNLGGGSIFLRGLTGNQSLIMIDGIRLNNSTFRYGPNQYLNTIPQSNLNKIELLRGSGSVQYGSDAIGGVIYIQTKNPHFSDKDFTANAVIHSRFMTSDIEKTLNAETNLAFKKTAVLLGFNYSDFGDLLAGGNIGYQRPTNYKQNSVNFKFLTNVIDLLDIYLCYQNVNQFNVPLYHKVVLENYEFNKMDLQARNLSYLSINYAFENSFTKNINLKAGFSESKENRSKKLNNKSTLTEEKDRVNTFFSILNIISKVGNNINISSGAEIYYDNVFSTRKDLDLSNNNIKILRGLYPDNSKFLSKAIYFLSEIKIDKFLVDLGFRYNDFNIKIEESPFGKIEIKPSAFVYNAGVVYKLAEDKSLFAALNTAFRSPNIDDLGTIGIVDFRYEVPSYSLKPEKALVQEVGFKISNNLFHLSISLFNNFLSDIITRKTSTYNGKDSIDGFRVYKKENVAKSIIYGSETDIRLLLGKLTVSANFSYTYGQNISTGEPMRRIPPLFGSLVLNFKINDNFSASLENLFAGKQNRLAPEDKSDNRINPNGTPGWFVLNSYLYYSLNHLDLILGLYNLFNAEYRYHGSGIDAIGRSVFLSIKLFY